MKKSVSNSIFSKIHDIAFNTDVNFNIGLYVCTLECVNRPKMKKYHATSIA